MTTKTTEMVIEIAEIDFLTGEQTTREPTKEEIEFHKEAIELTKARKEAIQDASAAKESAIAKLAKLGLTEAEMSALLGL